MQYITVITSAKKLDKVSSFYNFITIKSIHFKYPETFISWFSSPPLGDGGGNWAIFHKVYVVGAYVKLRYWLGIGTLGRFIFSRWDLKILCLKKWTWISNKKSDCVCNFYHFSFLVPYPSNFLVVCLCSLIFHGIYPTRKYFFVGLNFFFVSCA